MSLAVKEGHQTWCKHEKGTKYCKQGSGITAARLFLSIVRLDSFPLSSRLLHYQSCSKADPVVIPSVSMFVLAASHIVSYHIIPVHS